MKPTLTPADHQWFAGSQVTGPDGQPLVLLHGTHLIFDAFDDARLVRQGPYGRGFHFTSDRAVARHYSLGSKPVQAILRLVNPYRVDLDNPIVDGFDRKAIFRRAGATEKLVALGHDGVIVTQDDYIEAVVFAASSIRIVR